MNGTKVQIKYGFGKPADGSLKKAELAIDLDDRSLWTADENGVIVRVAYDTTEIEQEIEDIISNHDGDIANLQGQINNNAGDISALRDDFDNHDHALDDLSDVNASNPSRDDLLIWNGSSWSASSFNQIETSLNFKGANNVAKAAPSADKGDLYVNDTTGTASASWTGIAGKVVNAGNFIGYANSQWYLLGEIAEIGVTSVIQGLAISVDNSKPAEPVVSIDRKETDKWYADKGHDHSGVYEPVITPKNSAFNKSFAGSGSANTVSRSDHTHNYSPSDHDHAGVYEPVISPKRTAFNKDFAGTGSADTVSRSDHTHNYSPIGHDHAGVYEPVINPKRTAFNKDFGTTASTVAEGSHKHALDDLSDVSAANPTRDDLILWNGSNWVADDFSFIQTALRFKGGIAPTAAAPTNPEGGDLYVFDSNGTISSSWGVIAGTEVQAGKFVGWADTKNRWYTLGDMASVGVTDLIQGLGISVDDSKPAEPVVSVDRTETDKWYADKGHNHSGVYEPVINPKNSAFNKSFAGSGSAATVSRSDHTHSQYLTDYTETDPTVPAHVKSITPTNISNWNAAHGWGDHGSQGYLKKETVSAGSGSTVSDIKIVIGKTGTDPNTLYFVV